MRATKEQKEKAAKLLKSFKEEDEVLANAEPNTVEGENGEALPDVEGGLIDKVIGSLSPDVADAIEKSVVAPAEDETPFEEINPGALEVSESCTKLTNGTIDNKLSESKTKMDEESKNDSVLKWVKQAGGFDAPGVDDPNAFWDWAESNHLQSRPEDPARPELAKWTFLRIFKAFKRAQQRGEFNIDAWAPASEAHSAPSSIRHSAAPAPAEQDPNYQPSEGLRSLMNVTDLGDGEEIALTAADTVNQKYRAIKSKVRRVLSGRSLKKYFILCGDPGIGKSYLVNEVIDHMMIGDQVYYATGDAAGASRTSVGAFLYKTRHTPYIVLDDSDSMVMKNVNPAVGNMLKGAMDPDRGHKVTITGSVAKAISKFVSDEDLDQDLDDIQLDDDGNPIDTEEGAVPTTFAWSTPKMIMISNANEDMINPALLSRSDYYELHLTQEEYLVRLAFVIQNLDLNKGKNPDEIVYTNEEYAAAKDVVYETLVSCIEAANHNVPLAGMRVQLTHSLEFRLIKTLVDDWLRLYEDYSEEGLEGEALQKACLREFIRESIIPAL